MDRGLQVAAIDLGSNSFRLEICRAEHGHLVRAEYLKDTVRLGAGLDDSRQLDDASMQRGWASVARFAERLRDVDPGSVRAVATATLREAVNREVFVAKAQAQLGLPIDVISGHEEARLIYGGVSHFLPQTDEVRLVFDIGGRSTELISGQGAVPDSVESYPVGSVELSLRYFPDGRIHARNFEAARVAASAVLEGADEALGAQSWDAVYGASGTVGAVCDVLRAEGLTDGAITRAGMDTLIRRLLDAGHVDRVQLAGLKDDRRAVIGGGVAIVQALIDLLQLERIEAARGALRHGVMLELLSQHDAVQPDVRQATVQRLQRRFGIDTVHAQRVERMAAWLFDTLHPQADGSALRASRKLRFAALLHEIGMAVSHEDYHKHGEYILGKADAAGFAEHHLSHLSTLVLGQRGGLRKIEDRLQSNALLRDQLLALRMAIIFCHARRDPSPVQMRIGSAAPGWVLAVDAPWAEAHPLSMHLLHEEEKAWSRTPWPLQLSVV